MDNQQKEGMPNWIVFILTILGVIYLLNPFAGLFELIPDVIPWVGNLDEGAAALFVWQGIHRLIENRKARK